MIIRGTKGWIQRYRRQMSHGRCGICNQLRPLNKSSPKARGEKKKAYRAFQAEQTEFQFLNMKATGKKKKAEIKCWNCPRYFKPFRQNPPYNKTCWRCIPEEDKKKFALERMKKTLNLNETHELNMINPLEKS